MNKSQRKKSRISQVILILIILFLPLTACSEEGGSTVVQVEDNQVTKPSPALAETELKDIEILYGTSLRFDHISIDDGLSQSTVFCILQDSQGFMWFGTEDGLNKFDGYTFTIYKNVPTEPNSLSGNWILSMMEDHHGRLWIGTLEDGLEQYDREKDQFTHFRNDPEDPTSLSDNEITAIYQDQSGKIWLGTGDGGLNKLNEDEQTFTHYQYDSENTNSLSSNAITVIHEDQAGMLWIGTENNGLIRFDPGSELWWHYKNSPKDPGSLNNNRIKTILKDSLGVIWIGTDGGGMDMYDSEKDRFIHFQHNPEDPKTLSGDIVASIFQDREGILWIGTIGSGLNQYDPDTKTFYRYQQTSGDVYSLSNNYIISIFQDQEGVLWFGTFGAGLNKLNSGWINFPHYQHDVNNSNSLSENMIRAFFADTANSVWVGTLENGVDRFDRLNNFWQNFPNDQGDPESLSDNFVSSIFQDLAGLLWIGTASGLDKFDPATGTFAHFQAEPNAPPGTQENNVRAIYESSNGHFWIGTRGGLYRFDRDTNQWSSHYYHNPDDPESLSENWIFTMLEDKNGNIWLGTVDGGLNKFDPVSEKFEHFQHDENDPESLINNFVMSLFQDRNGELWVGTPGGLDRFELDTETFTHYREDDGLPNNTIYCILEDKEGNLWLSTNKGLSRFDSQTEVFVNFDVTAGLQSNEFNGNACHANGNGELFFGGINGFNVFLPENIQLNSLIPPVVITSLSKNNQEIDLELAEDGYSEITLNWPVNSIEFEYAALSFGQSEKNQYAYYLEGFENTWKEVGNRRFGQYTNLPGGTYTLRVKGSNNDGVWNEVGISVKITVVPPFWQTLWFYGIVIIAFLGLFYGGYRLRVRNLEERGRKLELEVEQRTSELMKTQASLKQSEMEYAITEERNRLARDLHDSVTQSIYSLTLLAEAGQRMIRSGDHTQAESNQIRLGEISQQALQEMRLLVYELRPQMLRSEGLVGALEHRLEAVERRAGIDARIQVDVEIDFIPRVEEEIFHISMEALNNSLKHAKATEVVVHFSSGEDSLILIIEDNGRGFIQKLARSQSGMGLAGMSERVENIGGNLSIQSESGTGTKVSVSIPLHTKDQTASDSTEEPS